jgi:small subunit ribosomal protein S20
MPHTSSAKKRLRQNLKRREHNRSVKKGIKVEVKKFLAAVKTGTPEQAREEFKLVTKRLDKAAGKKVLHRNTAARRKSRMAKMLNAKAAGGAAPKS